MPEFVESRVVEMRAAGALRGVTTLRERDKHRIAASEQSILHTVQNSMFEFPALPARGDILSFPGLRAHDQFDVA